MTELQQSRYDGLMRRVGDLKGPGSKVNDVLEELFPTIDVENVPGELLLLMGTRICWGGGALSAVAAEAGKYQLFNPAGSGKLVTITGVHFSAAAAVAARWGLNTVSFGAAVGTQTFRDGRNLTSGSPSALVRQLSIAALASGQNLTRILADTDFYLRDPNGVAVLSPGTGFEIGSSVVNVTTTGTFSWRERVAEPSELNL